MKKLIWAPALFFILLQSAVASQPWYQVCELDLNEIVREQAKSDYPELDFEGDCDLFGPIGETSRSFDNQIIICEGGLTHNYRFNTRADYQVQIIDLKSERQFIYDVTMGSLPFGYGACELKSIEGRELSK